MATRIIWHARLFLNGVLMRKKYLHLDTFLRNSGSIARSTDRHFSL